MKSRVRWTVHRGSNAARGRRVTRHPAQGGDVEWASPLQEHRWWGASRAPWERQQERESKHGRRVAWVKMTMSGGAPRVIKGLKEAQLAPTSDHGNKCPTVCPITSLAPHDPQGWCSVFCPASGRDTASHAMIMNGHPKRPHSPSGPNDARPGPSNDPDDHPECPTNGGWSKLGPK